MDDQRPTPSSSLHFKGYKFITPFDEHRVVIFGTMSGGSSIDLIPDANPYIKIKGNTIIGFDKNGNPRTGISNKDYYLRPLNENSFLLPTAEFIKFKAGTEISFGTDAQVVEGTIADDLTVTE